MTPRIPPPPKRCDIPTPPPPPLVSSSPLTFRPRCHRGTTGTGRWSRTAGTRRAAVPKRDSPGSAEQHGGQSARCPPTAPRRPQGPPEPRDGSPTDPPSRCPPTDPHRPPTDPHRPLPPLTHLRRPLEPRERRRGAAPRRGARPSPSRLQDPSRSPGPAAPDLRPPQPPLSVRIAPPPPPPVAVRPDPAREEELPAPPPTAPPADAAPPVTPNGSGGGGPGGGPALRFSSAAPRSGDGDDVRRDRELRGAAGRRQMRLQRAVLRDPHLHRPVQRRPPPSSPHEQRPPPSSPHEQRPPPSSPRALKTPTFITP